MKYIITLMIALSLCSCDKKGALEDISDEVIDHKQGIYIEITPMKKEDNK